MCFYDCSGVRQIRDTRARKHVYTRYVRMIAPNNVSRARFVAYHWAGHRRLDDIVPSGTKLTRGVNRAEFVGTFRSVC